MANRVRGQPLVVLAAVVAGWLGGRIATWDPMQPRAATAVMPQQPASRMRADGAGVAGLVTFGPQSMAAPVYPEMREPGGFDATLDEHALFRLMAAVLDYRAGRAQGPSMARAEVSYGAGGGAAGDPRETAAALPYSHWPGGGSAAQRFFLPTHLAGFDQGMLTPAGSSSPLVTAPSPSRPVRPAAADGISEQAASAPRRWSADAWALVRGGDGGAAVSGVMPASYGGSQAGAVLRYRIHPRSRLAPAAYMRTTSSMGALQESAAALGLSVTPVPSLPLVTAIEGRLVNGAGGNRVQPAAMAYTTLPAIELSRTLRAEIYGQGGYVGGQYATAFADGQARLDRQLASIGRIDARLGGGLWGGAQKGASRLDAGPSAIITMPLGKQYYGRVALDWRFRVAGDAQPDSGPALTLSAGF